jgi:hypothetical protein
MRGSGAIQEKPRQSEKSLATSKRDENLLWASPPVGVYGKVSISGRKRATN